MDDEPIPVTPIPRPWICLGSDKEIQDGMVVHSRPLVKTVISYCHIIITVPHIIIITMVSLPGVVTISYTHNFYTDIN